MTQSTHQVAAKGVDKTGAMFQSIGARAKATGAQIRSVMGGAIAAAGAYLSLRSVKSGIDELGNLSDMAMKAGTSVEFLTKTSEAFQIAGLDVSTGNLARAMQMMQKNTGESGQEGFFKLVRSIQQLPDDAQRAQAMVRVFGRAGLELAPLVTNGAEAIDNFQKLQNRIVGVSQSAAESGDRASDAIRRFTTDSKNLLLRGLGKIVGNWLDMFPGGVEAAVEAALAHLENFGKKAYAKVSKWGTNIMASFAWWKDLFSVGYDQANSVFAMTTNMANTEAQAYIDAANKKLRDKLAELKAETEDDRNKQRNPFGNKGGLAEEIGTAAAKAAHRVTNQLMLSGSSAANRLSVLGPEYQNETKKQTDLLRKIAQNTEKTAENTDEMGENYTPTDL